MTADATTKGAGSRQPAAGSPRPPHLAILGAGPIGLEAALAAVDAGFPFTLYEAAPEAAAHVREWGHVRLFTPWSMNVSPRARRHLAAAGHRVPDDPEVCPSGHELVDRVLDPLAALPSVRNRLRTSTRVVAVGRKGLLKHEAIGGGERRERPFRLLVEEAEVRRVEEADVVLDCTGTWGQPNAIGDGGIPAPGEEGLDGRLCRRIPDLAREAEAWRGRRILLVGAGHSAQTAALELGRFGERHPDTRLLWALRRESPDWTVDPNDPLPARAGLTRRARELARSSVPGVETLCGVAVEAFVPGDDGVQVILRRRDDSRETVSVDQVLALTGAVGDHALYRQLQVHECYATCGPMKLAAALLGAGSTDCLAQTSHGVESLRNPEPGFFILGSKAYGRNNTFLLRVGWEQVGEVFGAFGAEASRVASPEREGASQGVSGA